MGSEHHIRLSKQIPSKITLEYNEPIKNIIAKAEGMIKKLSHHNTVGSCREAVIVATSDLGQLNRQTHQLQALPTLPIILVDSLVRGDISPWTFVSAIQIILS